jgi:ribulose-phosphate 3-epimerase
VAANDAGVDFVHIDVVDGAYCGNFSFGPKTVSDLKRLSKAPVEAHLEMYDPQCYLDIFFEAGPDMVTIQSDSSACVLRTLEAIKRKGINAGIGFNSSVTIDQIKYYIAHADYVVLLCVEPGFGGQAMNPCIYEKVRAVRDFVDREGIATQIFIDGGVNEETGAALLECGADVLIVGSGIFTGDDILRDDIVANVRRFKSLADG